jgi:hypothetical protein
VVPLPGVTVRELGEIESEKFGGAFTTSVTVAVWLSAPLVPVIVSVKLPVGVLVVVVTVKVLLLEPVIEVGLNEPLAPLGSPLTPRLTVPLKPLSAVTVAV